MITDPQAAGELLNSLQTSGTRFVVLHRENDLQNGSLTSDVDIVTDCHPRVAISRLRESGAPFTLVCFWEYDVGAFSSCWTNRTGDYIIQIDASYDLKGDGRYGLVTDQVLSCAVPGQRFATAPVDVQETYKFIKAHLRKMPNPQSGPRMPGSIKPKFPLVISPRVRRALRIPPIPVIGRWTLLSFVRPLVRRAGRLWRRLRYPSGCVVRLHGPQAEAFAAAFVSKWADWLPNVSATSRPSLRLRTIARIRPGILVLTSRNPIAATSLRTPDDIGPRSIAAVEEAIIARLSFNAHLALTTRRSLS